MNDSFTDKEPDFALGIIMSWFRSPVIALIRTALLAAAITVVPLSAALSKPVPTESGLVSGVPGVDKAVTAFKGIPFAAPPVGDLRWAAPHPPLQWTGVREGSKFGANCIQSIVQERKPWTFEFMAHGEVSEDCLYLNIWTPAKSATDKHPVIVYLHGGGNNEGSGSVPTYDGEGLARKGVLMVTVNYRLGIYGFFTHPELTKESGHNTSGNYALLDQIAALQWVKKNIAAFGGDPARVTVAGQSAGASDIQLLTASPLAKGLFQRAILESGGSGFGGGGRKLADSEADGIKFAEAKGAHSLAGLRAMSWQDVSAPITAPALPPDAPGAAGEGRGRGGRGAGGLRFGPVIDGYVVPASPEEVFSQGKQNDVTTLAGWNFDENGASPHPTTTAEQFRAQAQQRYGDRAEEYLKLYPVTSDDEAKLRSNEAARDRQRVSISNWAAKRGETSKTKVYIYSWDHALPGPDADKYGAFHTSEVPYVLNALNMSDRPFTDADRKIADTASSYWANFAANGDPNGKGLPRWPAAGDKPGVVMELGDKVGPIPVAGDDVKFAFVKRLLQPPSGGSGR